VATALLLYEVARRSWMRGLRGNAPAPRLQRLQLLSPGPVPEGAEAGPVAGLPDPDVSMAEAPVIEPDQAFVDADPAMEADPVGEPAPAPPVSASPEDPQGDADLSLAPPAISESTGDGFNQDVLL